MLTTQQLEARRAGIGGSDVAALLGLSPWKTELDVYLSKVNEVEPQKETKRQRRGSAIEPLILDRFSREMGLQVEKLPTLKSAEHPFMLANLDGYLPGEAALVEAKCAWSAEGWGESGSAEVPAYYQTQSAHYFAVKPEARVCFFPVLFGMDGLDWELWSPDSGTDAIWRPVIADDADFRVFAVPRDDSFVGDVIEVERVFWHDHVLARVPPAPVNRADAMKPWSRDKGTAIVADEVLASKIITLKDLRAQQKALKERDEAIVDELTVAFGEAAIMKHGGNELATYKYQKRKGYTVEETEFRVLRLK